MAGYEETTNGMDNLSNCRACSGPTRGNCDLLCADCWQRVTQAAKNEYLKVWRLVVLYKRLDGPALVAMEKMLAAVARGEWRSDGEERTEGKRPADVSRVVETSPPLPEASSVEGPSSRREA